jgi:hypothetical protein
MELPLPPKDLVSTIPQFQFLQESLRNSDVSTLETVVFSTSTGQLVNGWHQQQEQVSSLSLERAHLIANTAKEILQSATALGSHAELLRIRFIDSELLVVPGDGLAIAAITTQKTT